jgi:hypothetical protein
MFGEDLSQIGGAGRRIGDLRGWRVDDGAEAAYNE